MNDLVNTFQLTANKRTNKQTKEFTTTKKTYRCKVEWRIQVVRWKSYLQSFSAPVIQNERIRSREEASEGQWAAARAHCFRGNFWNGNEEVQMRKCKETKLLILQTWYSCRKIKLKILDNPTIIEKHWKFIKWPIAPKVKEMQFKILNNYYPSAETLRGRFGFEVDPCDFCHEHPEQTEHLFFKQNIYSSFAQLAGSSGKMSTAGWKIKLVNLNNLPSKIF